MLVYSFKKAYATTGKSPINIFKWRRIIVNMGDFKQNLFMNLVSPQPRRLVMDVRTHTRRNPFQDNQLPPIKSSCLNEDEDRVLKEIRSILSKPSCALPPISKKTPSPSFVHTLKPPSRQKGNPIVNDDMFQELNSTASTFVSSFEEQ